MNKKYTIFIESTLVGLSVIALVVYFYVAFSRIGYPFTIEWIESNAFMNVVRVLEGLPLFAPPSYDFVQTIYTPLYYYLVALFAALTGQVMFSMRLVSVLASLHIFVMIYVLCRLRQVTPRLSITAVGLFAASYAVTGYWFDVGRVDTLFLAMLLTGYVSAMAHTKQDNALGALAGLVVFMSFATKQSALLAAPFLVLHLLLERRWKKAMWFGISLALSSALFVVIMNALSGGWFWIYVYKIPTAHPIFWDMVTRDFWTLHILPQFPWLIITIVLAAILLLALRDKAGAFNYARFALTFFLPLSTMSISSMAKQWGYLNGLLPVVAALSVMGTEAYHRVTTAAASNQRGALIQKGLYYSISGIMIVQFFALRYDFCAQIPTSVSLEAGYRILDLVRNSERPVFIPTLPCLLYMADQPTHFHVSSLGDLNLAAQNDPRIRDVSKEYQARISEHLQSKAIKTVLLPNANWYRNVFSTENGYECESLVADHPPLRTVTGAISYLDQICRFGKESQ